MFELQLPQSEPTPESRLPPRNIVNAIARAREQLRKSERKVADYVLSHASDVIHMRIVDLAQEAHVSEPTVVRFCRAIGCDGFQSFKLELAQYIAHSPRFGQFSLSEHDSAGDYLRNVFDATMDTLKRVRDSLDPRAIERAVAALVSAGRVEFYGVGASSAVAIDAQHKFFRLKIASHAHADAHMQVMAAMSLGPRDVVVAISQSGRTRALLETIQLARAAGATVIALAPGGSPVAEACDMPIAVDIAEETERYTPLPSRIAHLAVIDVLAVGVAKAMGPAAGAHLQALERGLQSLRVEVPPTAPRRRRK